MTSVKTFIIGDIHGCLDMLKRLMDKIAWMQDKDTLIFLGDYIDRGKDSKGVVDYILDLAGRSSRIECLKGNHETMFLNFLSGKDRKMFIANGGWKTLESYGPQGLQDEEFSIPSDHRVFYESLKLYIELDQHYVVWLWKSRQRRICSGSESPLSTLIMISEKKSSSRIRL